jgi:NAD-dependent dihydropyrimidine dehydrogenase PreA subunit
MIFYFSGTGNSLYVAKKIQESENDELINVSKALNEKNFNYKIKKDEKIGFVFPVYFYGLPIILIDFINKLKIETDEIPYIYTVITYGSAMGNADKSLEKLLKSNNLHLDGSFSVKMPENYVVIFNIDDEDKINLSLDRAEKDIGILVNDIKLNKKGNFAKHGYFKLFTPIVYKAYNMMRNTKKFHVNDNCTGCASCEQICPSNVIVMENKKPKWIKNKCSHCTACINRCLSKSIDYGNRTKKRRRYINPNVKFFDNY